jgi:hypothetical protein
MTTAEKIEQLVESAERCVDCFAVADGEHMIDLVHPVTGRTLIYGKTLEEVQAESPEYATAERMPVEEFLRRKAARQHAPITWAPTTEAKFWEMLECLPPACHVRGGFLVGEPWDHDAVTGEPRFQGFRQRGNVYEIGSRPMTRREFRAQLAA